MVLDMNVREEALRSIYENTLILIIGVYKAKAK